MEKFGTGSKKKSEGGVLSETAIQREKFSTQGAWAYPWATVKIEPLRLRGSVLDVNHMM